MIHAVACVILALLGPMSSERAAAWRDDLDFLRTEMPSKHLDAFHAIGKQDWEERIERLKNDLSGLDEDAAQVRLMTLIAAIGDGHTSVRPKATDSVYPLAFRALSDGVFVAAALEPHKDALGARLTAIDGKPVGEVLAAAATIVSRDNEEQFAMRRPVCSPFPVLSGLGIVRDPSSVIFTLENDGKIIEVKCSPQTGVARNAWQSVPAPAGATAPLVRTDVSKPYWWRSIDDGHTLYIAYNNCRDDPQNSFSTFTSEVMQASTGDVRRIVIDLRNNGGGNSAVAQPLISALQERKNEKGFVVVLIGRRTYSSAMMNAVQLRQRAGAVLIGEPTGGKPNSYGEIKSFTLPRTGFEIFYCTKYFRQVDGDPPSVEPDVCVETSSADWFGWHDPVIDAALAYQP